jgi:coenzyme PQQ precursor peptide PqqA
MVSFPFMALPGPARKADISFALGSGQIMCSRQRSPKALDRPWGVIYNHAHVPVLWAFRPIQWSQATEVSAMTWEAPEFVEVRMDAEINSYQDDFDREQDDRF